VVLCPDERQVFQPWARERQCPTKAIHASTLQGVNTGNVSRFPIPGRLLSCSVRFPSPSAPDAKGNLPDLHMTQLEG
jgi:hypothetical protein